MNYCQNCRKQLHGDEIFCPKCGERLTKGRSQDLFASPTFDNFFKDFNLDMPNIDKIFKKPIFRDFEILDLTPQFFRKPKTTKKGFTIKMSRKQNEEPKVEVETFGDVDPEYIRSKIPINFKIPKKESKDVQKDKPKKVAKEYSEPAAETRWIEDELHIAINLPEIYQEKDIQIDQLTESIEIRAVGEKKGYFKIVQIPKGAKIISQEFVPQKLILRIKK